MAKVSNMVNNHSFPSVNFPASAQPRQPGHWAAYLLGARKSPPPPTQQELNVVWANHLLDGRQLHQEEEESSSDDANIDPQLHLQTWNQPNMAQPEVLQPLLQTQGVPAPGQCFILFQDPTLTSQCGITDHQITVHVPIGKNINQDLSFPADIPHNDFLNHIYVQMSLNHEKDELGWQTCDVGDCTTAQHLASTSNVNQAFDTILDMMKSTCHKKPVFMKVKHHD